MNLVRVRSSFIPSLAASMALLGAAATSFGNTGDPLQLAPIPADNPQTAAKVQLGKELFWDVRMSTNDTVSCGSCHTPEAGGSHPLSLNAASKNPGADGVFNTADDVFGSIGVWGQTTGRNAPNFMNTQFQAHQFWDRRAGPDFFSTTNPGQLLVRNGSLESQAVGPPRSPVEMGFIGRTPSQIEAKFQPLNGSISTGTPYTTLFANAFGVPDSPAAVTFDRMGMAIAAYERSVMTDQSPFHLMAANGNPAFLTTQQNDGWDVFRGAGRCDKCHVRGENFSDGQVHNIGVTPIAFDLGTFNTTGRVRHMGAFKTGVLNDLSANAPYFHGGQMMTLEELVDFYDRGGDNHVQQDPLIRPLGLSSQEKDDLVEFLRNGISDPRALNGLAPFDHPNVASAVASFADMSNPSVSLLSPNLGNQLQGQIKFTASASDDQNVAKVSFKLDGGLFVDDPSAPYTRTVGPLGDGGHFITLRATDASGNETTVGPLGFTVNSAAADLTVPEISFKSPNGKTPVGGTAVKVSVDAFDNLGVTRVDYSVDAGGTLASGNTGPNFATTLNLSALSNGTHTLKAIAFDAANNASTQATLDVTILNSTGFPKASLPIAGEGVIGAAGAITFTGTFTATSGSIRIVATGLPVPVNPTGRFTVVLNSPLSDITMGTIRPNALGNVTATLRTPRGDNRNRAFWADTVDLLDGTTLIGSGIIDAALAATGRATVLGRIGALRITFRTTITTATIGPNEGDILGTVDAIRVPAGTYLARFTGPGGDFDVPFAPDAAGLVAVERTFPREMLSTALQFNTVLIFQNGVQIGTARITVR